MMLKSLCMQGAVLAFAAVQVAAHAAINPAMGVTGTATRNDVKNPSNNNACGGVDAAGAIDGSTAVQADASGSFTVSVENFNGGQDGSREVTVRVNAAGDGQDFVDGTVTANGNPAPNDNASEQVTASLPAGTTCTGGASGDLCIASFTTSAGFGNCVVVQQAGGGAGAGGNANNGNANNNGNASNNNGNANGDNNGNANGNNNGNGNGNGNNNGNANGNNNGNANGNNNGGNNGGNNNGGNNGGSNNGGNNGGNNNGGNNADTNANNGNNGINQNADANGNNNGNGNNNNNGNGNNNRRLRTRSRAFRVRM